MALKFGQLFFVLLLLQIWIQKGQGVEDFFHGTQEYAADAESENSAASRQTVTQDANALFAEFWEYKMSTEPEFATSVGVHTYNDKLDKQSPNDFQRRQAKLTRFVTRAYHLLPYADEGTLTKRNLQIFISQNTFQISLLRIGNHLLPVSYLEGPHMNLMFLLDYQPVKTSKDYQDLISRYRAFPQQVEDNIQLMDRGIQLHITQHQRSLKNVESTLSSFAQPAEDSLFYEPFKTISSSVPQEEVAGIQQSAKDVIDQKVSPAFRRLEEYVKNVYSKNTRSDIAASSLPNDFYKTILNFHATVPVNAEDIHKMGEREVARIALEMKAVIESLGSNLTVRDFNEQLRKDPKFLFNSEEEALEEYRDVILNKIQPKLPLLFKNIPKAQILIKKVPENMVGGPQAYYLPGSGDGTSQGTFFVDTSSLKDLPKYNVITLSLHEGLPGHHLQVSYAMESEGVPEFRKYIQVPVNTAFLEGWALYSEFLGYELGLFDDPYSLYGHLSEEIFRACRLVVDTGIHAFGWSRQRAIDYMVEHSAKTVQTVEKEVDRYITWPGQACAYKFGELKIKELRKRATDALGDKFDLKEFHDVILRNNGPLTIVEQEVNRMIAAAQ